MHTFYNYKTLIRVHKYFEGHIIGNVVYIVTTIPGCMSVTASGDVREGGRLYGWNTRTQWDGWIDGRDHIYVLLKCEYGGGLFLESFGCPPGL